MLKYNYLENIPSEGWNNIKNILKFQVISPDLWFIIIKFILLI